MKRFVHPLLMILARATEKELVQMIEYLKTENRILRNKLPKRIEVTLAEREKLLKLGVRLGSKIKEVISIVHPRTFTRWLSEKTSGVKRRKRGRPRTPEQICQLILDMAKDTGWGYGRIIGELKKLRIRISQATVSRILQDNGFDPGPKRDRGSWHDFIQRHIKTVWATDFFTKTVWTVRGPVTYYVLFFIHLHTRRIHVAGMTPNPDGGWMAQIARNMSMVFAEEKAEFQPTHIIRDRDSKFTEQFCSILETDGIDFRPTPSRSPNLNCYSEVWVRRVKEECLNHFIVFGESHLRHIMEQWLTHIIFIGPTKGWATSLSVPTCRHRCRSRSSILMTLSAMSHSVGCSGIMNGERQLEAEAVPAACYWSLHIVAGLLVLRMAIISSQFEGSKQSCNFRSQPRLAS